MNLRLLHVIGLLASAAIEAGVVLLNSWRAWLPGHANTYRPEAHYMRGPGPKWHEKHSRGAPTAAQ
jgi:hypothetical protein